LSGQLFALIAYFATTSERYASGKVYSIFITILFGLEDAKLSGFA
jgi:hypothetical protein